MGGQERVAPEIEEAVVEAHRLHAEQLAQDLHQPPLGRVARRRVGDVETRPDMPPDGRRGHRGSAGTGASTGRDDRRRHSRLGTRLDPIALALERIGRQRHAAPRLVRPERGPVGAQAGEPEPPHGLEQEGEVVRALEGVAQGRQRHRIGPPTPPDTEDCCSAQELSVCPGPTSTSTRPGSRHSSPPRPRTAPCRAGAPPSRRGPSPLRR